MKLKLAIMTLFFGVAVVSHAEDIFKSVKNEKNQRWAIFEDDGKAGWLYITEPRIQKPVSSVFVYSRVPPIKKEKAKEMMRQGNAPIIVDSYVNELTVRKSVKEKDIVVKWSKDGKAVVVFIEKKPVTLLIVGDQKGFSKGLSKKGLFGKPWNDAMYLKFFGEKKN